MSKRERKERERERREISYKQVNEYNILNYDNSCEENKQDFQAGEYRMRRVFGLGDQGGVAEEVSFQMSPKNQESAM